MKNWNRLHRYLNVILIIALYMAMMPVRFTASATRPTEARYASAPLEQAVIADPPKALPTTLQLAQSQDIAITIRKNNIEDNNAFGLWSAVQLVAEDNWWGDSSGPHHPTLNPDGQGDEVSDNVDFDPWRSQPVPFPFEVLPPPLPTYGDVIACYSNIEDNTNYGVSGTVPVIARKNWWGDASGPYHPQFNPDGQGNPVSDNVDFAPWLSSPVDIYAPPQITSGTPALIEPASGTTTGDRTPSFDWSDVSDAWKYQIQVDDSNDFTQPEIDQQTADSNYTSRMPLANGTYYWRVRARCPCAEWGDWSDVGFYSIGSTLGEAPPTTPKPAPSPTDDDEFLVTVTDTSTQANRDSGYKYRSEGPITFSITTTRYYGTVDASGHLTERAGYAIPNPIGKSVSPTSTLTIVAYDVDTDRGEINTVYLNGHQVGTLKGHNGAWEANTFQVFTEWLRFPDLSEDPNNPEPVTVNAGNTISVSIDDGQGGFATEIAWAKLEIPGTRPVLLVHGFYAESCNKLRTYTSRDNGWVAWQHWVDTARYYDEEEGKLIPVGFLPRYAFPNIDPDLENVTSGQSDTGSDARVYLNGCDVRKINSPLIVTHTLRILSRYGVDKVNLVGHSKGGTDIRYALHLLHEQGKKVVQNVVMLGSPNEGLHPVLGIPAKWFGFDAGREHAEDSMRKFNAGAIHFEDINFHTTAGDKGRLESFLPPNDRYIEVASVHASKWEDPPNYAITDTLHLDHTELHSSETVFSKVRNMLQPPEVTGQASGQAAYASRSSKVEKRSVSSSSLASEGSTTHLQNAAAITGTIGASEVHTTTITIDGQMADVTLGWDYAEDMGLVLYDPNGQRIDPSTVSPNITYTAPITDHKWLDYLIQDPVQGLWTAEITVTNPYTDGEEYLLSAIVSSTITMAPSTDKDLYEFGEPLKIMVTLTDDSIPITVAVVTATVFLPDTTLVTFNLYDDGSHDDGAAGDGVYANTFAGTTQSGDYWISIGASGTSNGIAFTRIGFTQAAVKSTGAAFTDSYLEDVIDSDGDGLYNTLVIQMDISVIEAGSYRVLGTLTDGSGSPVAEASTRTTLTAGAHDILLQFDGRGIAQSGLDGPYELRDLTLFDLGGTTPVQADYRAIAYATSAYTYNQFQRDPIIVSTYAADQGVDTNSNGKYDLLRINASFDVRYADTYTITARLLDADWQEVASIYAATNLVTGTNSVPLDFNGAEISVSGRNGPYYVRDLMITCGFDPAAYLLISDFYTTQAYNYTDFDIAVLQVAPVALTFYAQKGGANPLPKSVSIANAGGGLLNWTATKDTDWLSMNPTSGTVPISMSVSVDVAGLAADIYTGTITVTATISGSQNSPQEISAKLCNLFGDLNCDCVVNVADIMEVAAKWRCRCEDACYDARYDIDSDCDIDIVDIMQVVARWEETCG